MGDPWLEMILREYFRIPCMGDPWQEMSLREYFRIPCMADPWQEMSHRQPCLLGIGGVWWNTKLLGGEGMGHGAWGLGQGA